MKPGTSELLLMGTESSSKASKGRQCSRRWILVIAFPGSGQDSISVTDRTL